MNIRLKYALDIAYNDENIRAVVLYGSRANSYVPSDVYQDYDLIYVVKDRELFDVSVYEDVGLIYVPSKIYPELLVNEDVYLMQFSDFSRIDLTVCKIEDFYNNYNDGRMMKCLLDKDNCIKKLNDTDNSSYWIKPITEQFFKDTCAEFFWEIQNAVKGIKRDELSFAMFLRDISVRDMFNRIIDTYIGMNNDYKVTVGTLGKYRKNYLSTEQYKLYKDTYLSNTYFDCEKSIYSMIYLFVPLAKEIATKYNFEYPEKSENFVLHYLNCTFDNQ